MSSEDSEVDDFFDAEEDTSVGPVSGRRCGGDTDAVTRCRLAQLSSDSLDDSSESGAAPSSPKAAVGVSGGELEARRNKLAHLRENVTGEVASGASGGGCDDEGPTTSSSPQHSQSGSVETARASSHPFRKMEPDAQSLVSQLSLGKLGRILSGQEELEQLPGSMPPPAAPPPLQQPPPPAVPPPPTPTSSAPAPIPATSTPAALQPPPPPLQEPDIVSSAKGIVLPASPVPPTEDVPAAGVSCDDDGESADIPPLPMVLIAPAPVAPPRRRRKRLVNSQLTSPPLSTPGSSCASMTPSPSSVALTPSPGSVAPIASDACLLVPPTASLRTRRLRRSLLCHQQVPERPDVSLDLRAAVRGQCLVKPQDEESTRAPPITAADRLDVISVQSDASSLADSLASSYIGAHSSSRDMLRLDELKEAQEFLRSHEIQTDICVKTKTDSGRRMTDKEILDQVSVLNLDTGERIPLSAAEERLPGCINPLSLQIMRMTSEYVSDSSLERDGSDDDQARLVIPPRETDEQPDSSAVRRKTERLKRFLGRTVNKARDRAETLAQKMAQVRHREEKDAFECMAEVADSLTVVRVPMKASSSHKGPYEFDQMLFVQDLSGEHIGPIWCMKFSSCGRLLATAGQDHVLRVWVLKSAYRYFFDMRTKYSAEKVSPTPSQESLVSQQSSDEALLAAASAEATTEEEAYAPFMPRPLCKYTGHTADLLDISWSKNYFILSSSMDKTVRLWHISRKECLCCFQHIEFVTAIAFHPKDDRYFLSGSLDGKLRLWNIPDKKVALWNELDGQAKLITAANFCQNGRFAVVGSYDGRCVFYSTDQLKYHTQIHVRSSRGRNARGRKISGIEPMPGEDKILVTSNDSRIRVYDLRDLNLSCKYKGFVNSSSQIKASFSHDGKFIVAGSENQCVYLWKTHHDYSKFSSVRRDRNDFWEGIRAHEAQVTCALFAPHPDLVFQYVDAELGRLETVAEEAPSTPGAGEKDSQSSRRSEEAKKDSLDKKSVGSGGTSTAGYVVVTADFNGVIKVFLNRTRPKHSSLPASALL